MGCFCGGGDDSDKGGGGRWCWLLSEEERKVGLHCCFLERETPIREGERHCYQTARGMMVLE